MAAAIRAVLFDLDGTLADTAPDLGGALNRVRIEDGLTPLPIERLRRVVSQGVRGLLRVSYGITPDSPHYPALSERVLAYYQARICTETRLFPGIAELLGALDAAHIRWGIVTNKHSRFTLPLVRALTLDSRAGVIVSGDTTAKPKPAPEPLLHACNALGLLPADCIYLGDDERDIAAARAAGMPSVAVRWGYLGEGTPVEAWGADYLVDHPSELLAVLDEAAARA